MAQWFRIPALLEDPRSVSSTHVGWLTTTCNPTSQRSSAHLLDPVDTQLHSYVNKHKGQYAYRIHKNKKKSF